MTSKTTVNEKPQTYPYLGILNRSLDNANGTIVLFAGPTRGMVVFSTGKYDLGYYSENWSVDRFDAFNGTVTLDNN